MKKPWLLLVILGLFGITLIILVLFALPPQLGAKLGMQRISQENDDLTSPPLSIPLFLSRFRSPQVELEGNPRLDNVLNKILTEYETSGLDEALAFAPQAIHDTDLIPVVIRTSAGDSTMTSAQSLSEMGIEPQFVAGNHIWAQLSVPLLSNISNLDGVIHVQVDNLPGLGQSRSSSTQSLSNHAAPFHDANAWHAAGFEGQSIRVAIIDLGFANYSQEVQNGNVKEPAAVMCFRSEQNYSSSLEECERGGVSHGTEVAESLYEIAPEVTVYLVRVSQPWQLLIAVDWLAGQNVDIVSQSLQWDWDGPGDGISLELESLLLSVDRAVRNGITWISEAGNSNDKTWYGPFNPLKRGFSWSKTNQDYWHVFHASLPFNLGSSTCNYVKLQRGESLQVELRWEETEWFFPERKLKIIVYDPKGEQKGQMSQFGIIPFEQLNMVAAEDGYYCIRVLFSRRNLGRSVTAPSWIQLEIKSPQKLQYFSSASIVVNPAESRNRGLRKASYTPDQPIQSLESFTSWELIPIVRVKANLAGAFTTVFNGDFPSNSQSAPHVAGLAALVKQKYPHFTPMQIVAYLKSNAVPRFGPASGSAVSINILGYGLVQIPAPFPEISMPLFGVSKVDFVEFPECASSGAENNQCLLPVAMQINADLQTNEIADFLINFRRKLSIVPKIR